MADTLLDQMRQYLEVLKRTRSWEGYYRLDDPILQRLQSEGYIDIKMSGVVIHRDQVSTTDT